MLQKLMSPCSLGSIIDFQEMRSRGALSGIKDDITFRPRELRYKGVKRRSPINEDLTTESVGCPDQDTLRNCKSLRRMRNAHFASFYSTDLSLNHLIQEQDHPIHQPPPLALKSQISPSPPVFRRCCRTTRPSSQRKLSQPLCYFPLSSRPTWEATPCH